MQDTLSLNWLAFLRNLSAIECLAVAIPVFSFLAINLGLAARYLRLEKIAARRVSVCIPKAEDLQLPSKSNLTSQRNESSERNYLRQYMQDKSTSRSLP